LRSAQAVPGVETFADRKKLTARFQQIVESPISHLALVSRMGAVAEEPSSL
jgi:hypothetical protein